MNRFNKDGKLPAEYKLFDLAIKELENCKDDLEAIATEAKSITTARDIANESINAINAFISNHKPETVEEILENTRHKVDRGYEINPNEVRKLLQVAEHYYHQSENQSKNENTEYITGKSS